MGRAAQTPVSAFLGAYAFGRATSLPRAFKMEAGDASLEPEAVSLLLAETRWAQRLQPHLWWENP